MYYLLGSAIVLAGFFVVHAVLTGAVRLTAEFGQRFFEPVRPLKRARILFVFQVAPLAGALIVAALLLISFLLYEPYQTKETVGWLLGLCAVGTVFGVARAAIRMFAVRRSTRRLISGWEQNSTMTEVKGWSGSAYRLEHPFPLIAVVGVLRPRLFVAAKVLENLEDAELAAAVAHEQGHLLAADNLKRIVIDVCAAFAWWMPGVKRMRSQWADAAELAADEFASIGDKSQPLNLASALVKLARLTPAGTRPAMPAGAFLVEATGDILSRRVNWLIDVNVEQLDSRYERWRTNLMVAAAGSMVFVLALALIRYELFAVTHRLIEFVVQ